MDGLQLVSGLPPVHLKTCTQIGIGRNENPTKIIDDSSGIVNYIVPLLPLPLPVSFVEVHVSSLEEGPVLCCILCKVPCTPINITNIKK